MNVFVKKLRRNLIFIKGKYISFIGWFLNQPKQKSHECMNVFVKKPRRNLIFIEM